MRVVIAAPESDQGTAHIAELVRRSLERLSEAVSGEYGGSMEHLFIDLELVPGDADRRAPWSFRFQKRVAPKPIAGLPKLELKNVGHYSVRPDYFALAQVDLADVPRYLANIIYESTVVLETKRRQLGAFDVRQFRAKLLREIQAMGAAANEA